MSLCVEHMACCLFGAMCSHVDCLSPPILLLNHCSSGFSCVALVTLRLSPYIVSSPVLIRCLSCVLRRECFMLTVLQSYACLLVFPLRGGFCSSLFYFIIKRNNSLHLSPRPHLSWQNGSAKMRTQQRRGLGRPPPDTISSPLYQRILQYEALSCPAVSRAMTWGVLPWSSVVQLRG